MTLSGIVTCEFGPASDSFMIAFNGFISPAKFLQEDAEIIVNVRHVRSVEKRLSVSRLSLRVTALGGENVG